MLFICWCRLTVASNPSAPQIIAVMFNGLCTDLKVKYTFDLKGGNIPNLISCLHASMHPRALVLMRACMVYTGSSHNRYVTPDKGTDQVLKVCGAEVIVTPGQGWVSDNQYLHRETLLCVAIVSCEVRAGNRTNASISCTTPRWARFTLPVGTSPYVQEFYIALSPFFRILTWANSSCDWVPN